MTHADNLDSILTAGEIYSKNKMGTRPFKSIANSSVQERRSKVIVPQSGRPLHDYVPLYFGNRTPMSAVVQDHNEDIFFFRFSLEILVHQGLIFTDGNAAASVTKFFEYDGIESLRKLDVATINRPNYSGDDEKKRKKAAEILIPDALSLSQVLDIICFSEIAKSRILSALKKHDRTWRINVNPGTWYFQTPSKGK
jgi:hypothetical protein